MTKFLFTVRAVALSAAFLCLASCNRPTPPEAPAGAPTPTSESSAAEMVPTVAFGEGFMKEEATGTVVLRWVRRDATLRVPAPTEGRYRLTFRAVTVFSTVENTIEVSVNGASAGTFTARAFDLANPTLTILDASLRAGGNEVRLRSKGEETRLGETDDRTPAYGLVVPIQVERVP